MLFKEDPRDGGWSAYLNNNQFILSSDLLAFDESGNSFHLDMYCKKIDDDYRLDYSIVFKDDLNSNFLGDQGEGEIQLSYEIPAGKDGRNNYFSQKILAGDNCDIDVSQEYVEIEYEAFPHLSVNGKTPVTSIIDIATDKISPNEDLYKENDLRSIATLSFCTITELGLVSYINGSGEEVQSAISFSLLKVVIDFNLQIGFSSAQVTVDEADTLANEADPINIISTIQSCLCDPQDGDTSSIAPCIAGKSYSQNDLLKVCIYDETRSVSITSFRSVSLLQPSTGINVVTIDEAGNLSSLTSINQLSTSTSMISNRIISVFFNNNDQKLTFSGIAIIRFSSQRKLYAIRSEESDGASFALDVQLTSNESPGSDTRSKFSVCCSFIVSFSSLIYLLVTEM